MTESFVGRERRCYVWVGKRRVGVRMEIGRWERWVWVIEDLWLRGWWPGGGGLRMILTRLGLRLLLGSWVNDRLFYCLLNAPMDGASLPDIPDVNFGWSVLLVERTRV